MKSTLASSLDHIINMLQLKQKMIKAEVLLTFFFIVFNEETT